MLAKPARLLLLVTAWGAGACGPERPPKPGVLPSPTPYGPASASPPADLPADAYQVEWSEIPVPATLAPAARFDVSVGFKNISSHTWPASGQGLYAVRVSYRWFRSGGESLTEYGGLRIPLSGALGPGQSTQVVASLVAPKAPGDYEVQFDLVYEGVAWFAARGASRKFVSIKVR